LLPYVYFHFDFRIVSKVKTDSDGLQLIEALEPETAEI